MVEQGFGFGSETLLLSWLNVLTFYNETEQTPVHLALEVPSEEFTHPSFLGVKD